MSISLADQIAYIDSHLQQLMRDHKKMSAEYEKCSWGEYGLRDASRHNRLMTAQLRTVRAILETLRGLAEVAAKDKELAANETFCVPITEQKRDMG